MEMSALDVLNAMKNDEQPSTKRNEPEKEIPNNMTGDGKYKVLIENLAVAYNGKKAIKNLLPLQLGDVPETYADIGELMEHYGFEPLTSLKEGVRKFVAWYREYYKV